MGRSTIRLCAPVMNHQSAHAFMAWCVELPPDSANGLTKPSTADASQTRALDVVRLQKKLGEVSAIKLENITGALILIVGRKVD